MADSDDKDSKTEEPSEKKIRDALDKGQTPFSKETTLFASFVAILSFTFFFAYSTFVNLGEFLSLFIEKPHDWLLENNADAIVLSQLVAVEIGKAVFIAFAMMMAFGLAGAMLQTPPQIAVDRITPKFERISLAKGWKRMFGSQGLSEFVKSVAKVVFATAFVVFALRDAPVRLLDGMSTSPTTFAAVMLDIAVEMLMTVTLIMALIAVADLVWSRHQWRSNLRMSKQEVKDEHKQQEGDPIVKARIRSLQRDRARNRMIAAVPQATLVIANPTHFSIALRYDRERDAAPVVVAKGQDLVALKIREIAKEHNIPVFEDVALARSMYSQVSIDSVIPSQFYQAVAELIRIIYANNAKKAPSPGPA